MKSAVAYASRSISTASRHICASHPEIKDMSRASLKKPPESEQVADYDALLTPLTRRHANSGHIVCHLNCDKADAKGLKAEYASIRKGSLKQLKQLDDFLLL